MRLKGLGTLKKKSFTSLGIKPATFGLVAQFLNPYAQRAVASGSITVSKMSCHSK
jgi:hypothetical protein